MREYLQAGISGAPAASTSLHAMMGRLMAGLQPSAAVSKTILVNEIDPDLFTVAQEQAISPVFRELLSAVMRNARNGRIHVQASRFRDIITLEIEERNNYNGYALDSSIRQLEPVARMLGGYISMKGHQQLQVNITFSFPDQLVPVAFC